jgi:hypothetical protein
MTTLATARIFLKVPGAHRSDDDPALQDRPSERLRFPFVRHDNVGRPADSGVAGFPRFMENPANPVFGRRKVTYRPKRNWGIPENFRIPRIKTA